MTEEQILELGPYIVYFFTNEEVPGVWMAWSLFVRTSELGQESATCRRHRAPGTYPTQAAAMAAAEQQAGRLYKDGKTGL